MSTSAIVLLSIIASVNAFEHVETQFGPKISAQTLIGQWYIVAAIDPQLGHHMQICNVQNITSGINNYTVNINEKIGTREAVHTYEGTGSVVNRTLYRKYFDGNNVHTFMYSIESFDNGDGLILQDQFDGARRYIWQALPNKTNLTETNAEFIRQAADLGAEIIYFERESCQ